MTKLKENIEVWNGSAVKISCCADLAWSLAGIKNSPKNFCSHVIFIIFFKFQIRIAGACTVKLGNKERFDKEQIDIKEPFPVTNLPFTTVVFSY